MSAVVVDLSSFRARRMRLQNPLSGGHDTSPRDVPTCDFTFWSGASGARYVHTIYELRDCPDLPSANIVLVRRRASGSMDIARICRVENETMSLNLAEIRRLAAQLGANEVHVHLLARDDIERAQIERDISRCGEIATAATH
jgi:hypothetical protein